MTCTIYILAPPGMREKDMKDIVRRVKFVFSDKIYRERVDNSDKRWLDDEIEVVFGRIVEYLEKFK